MKSDDVNLAGVPQGFDSAAERSAKPDLKDPHVVLSLLETDQVVAAKRQTRFGRRDLSLGVRVLLWSLRVYVVAMFVFVFVSVVRAIHPGP
ncbi:MAG TPA: hypothetical protein VJO53_05025 [Candidatus Acidoferrales bacterium]|nr:hypothetical protein [Candidatus Acidoferrales bacterium]